MSSINEQPRQILATTIFIIILMVGMCVIISIQIPEVGLVIWSLAGIAGLSWIIAGIMQRGNHTTTDEPK